MKMTEQGVLKNSSAARLLFHFLLSAFFFLSTPAQADNEAIATPDIKHHVYILYEADSVLHSEISNKLSKSITQNRSDTTVSIFATKEKINNFNKKTDLIVGIGHLAIKNAKQQFPNIKKLFIDTKSTRNQLGRDNAFLYLTQPYCRQILFIKQLNTRWKTISILNSQKNHIEIPAIKQCTNEYDMDLFTVKATKKDNLTNLIKNALNHSDVLLALPDSSIYNSRTVKNILLTSYRYRKPVIAFSKNFTNAGALASISSNTDQVTKSATEIIDNYYKSGMKFTNKTNYPDSFETHINRQVFRALNITVPDIEKIKESLRRQMKNKSGKSQ